MRRAAPRPWPACRRTTSRETGQLWGNPLYDWQRDAARSASASGARACARQLERVDLLRIDHFRALRRALVRARRARRTRAAASGCRRRGARCCSRCAQDCGDLPIVAEDLGVITPDVEALLRKFGLPGMRVLQFAFSATRDNPHLPHMHTRNSVVYTGTHDNDTTLGWFRSSGRRHAVSGHFLLRSLPQDVVEAMMRAALGSVGHLAIIPVQDLLALGSDARLNTPGTASGNWQWRMAPQCLGPELAPGFLRLNRIYGRA